MTNCQTKDLIKIDKCLSKWPSRNQIGHIEWIRFSQIDHHDFTFNQIDHYDLIFTYEPYPFDDLTYLLNLSYLFKLTQLVG